MKLVVKRTKDGNRKLDYWENENILAVEINGANLIVRNDRGGRVLNLNKKEANRLTSTILKLAKLLE